VEVSVAPPLTKLLSRLRAPAPLTLGADQQATVSPSMAEPVLIRQVKGQEEIAWTTGRLEFEDEPIAEIADRFNRYNRIQIRIQGSDLGGRRITGSFKINDPLAFVALIQSIVGVSAVQQGTEVIVRQAALGESGIGKK